MNRKLAITFDEIKPEDLESQNTEVEQEENSLVEKTTHHGEFAVRQEPKKKTYLEEYKPTIGPRR